MLGFRGHFASKSRRYSTTLGRLRSARRRFERAKAFSPDGVVDVAALDQELVDDDILSACHLDRRVTWESNESPLIANSSHLARQLLSSQTGALD